MGNSPALATAPTASHLGVVNPRQLLESLVPDHDGSQVGRVAGQHEQAEDGPQVHEQTPGGALGCLAGHCASKQDGVAEVEGRGVGENGAAVPAAGCEAIGAAPLIQREEERGEVQGGKDAQPHGPVQRPHKGPEG